MREPTNIEGLGLSEQGIIAIKIDVDVLPGLWRGGHEHVPRMDKQIANLLEHPTVIWSYHMCAHFTAPEPVQPNQPIASQIANENSWLSHGKSG